jgi:hypothetical protein
MKPTRVLVRLPASAVRKRLSAALPRAAEDLPVPDPLIRATVRAAARVVRGELAPLEVMSAGASTLVDDAIQALAGKRWRLG